MNVHKYVDRTPVIRTEKNPFHDRISRLAYARNQYLELVLERYSEIQNEYDDCYMVVFDLDFTCEINFESIGNALSLREHWGMQYRSTLCLTLYESEYLTINSPVSVFDLRHKLPVQRIGIGLVRKDMLNVRGGSSFRLSRESCV
jgi:hypothetical protein